MTHTHSQVALSVAAIAIFALFAYAGVAFATPVEKTDGFVCPVFNDDSAVGAHNPNSVQIGGGDYSIIGPDVAVPVTATNDDGLGAPGGDHTAPGDSMYTAVWAG